MAQKNFFIILSRQNLDLKSLKGCCHKGFITAYIECIFFCKHIFICWIVIHMFCITNILIQIKIFENIGICSSFEHIKLGEGHFGTAVSAPPTRRHRFGAELLGVVPFWRRTFRRRFIIFFIFDLWRKNNEAGNFLNAVEREPVETRVLNPTATEASYKPKQRSCRTTNLKKKVLVPNRPGAEMSCAETGAPNRRRRIVPDPSYINIYVYIQNLNLHYTNMMKKKYFEG